MAKTPWVDADECVGCGACVDECPDVFTMDDDKSVVKNPQGASEDAIQEAMDVCPVECIHWRD